LSVVDPAAVETPIGCVDLQRVRSNAKKIASYAEEHGLKWRPHIKTHKSREIARLQIDAGATGITVATLREAEVRGSYPFRRAIISCFYAIFKAAGSTLCCKSDIFRRLMQMIRCEMSILPGHRDTGMTKLFAT